MNIILVNNIEYRITFWKRCVLSNFGIKADGFVAEQPSRTFSVLNPQGFGFGLATNGRLLNASTYLSKSPDFGLFHVQQSMTRKGTFYDHRLCTCQHPRPKPRASSGCAGDSGRWTDLSGKIHRNTPRTTWTVAVSPYAPVGWCIGCVEARPPRSKDLVETVQDLKDRGISFKSLTEFIDTTSSGGRLVFHIFDALAEFERDLIRERTIAGLQAARARGIKGGRKPAMSDSHVRKAAAMLSDPSITKKEVAVHFGVSRTTLNASLQRIENREPRPWQPSQFMY